MTETFTLCILGQEGGGGGTRGTIFSQSISLEEENLFNVYIFLKDRMHFSHQILNQGFFNSKC